MGSQPRNLAAEFIEGVGVFAIIARVLTGGVNGCLDTNDLQFHMIQGRLSIVLPTSARMVFALSDGLTVEQYVVW